MFFSDQVLQYHFQLTTDIVLPDGIEWLLPYENEETRRCMREFYSRFYHDERNRIFILGINPGRFGAGITGVPFTDPIRLEKLGIQNSFVKKQELSSVFIYDMIDRCGGPDLFFSKYYIASLSPLGLIKDGVNYNYYDDHKLAKAIEPLIIQNIEAQRKFGCVDDVVYCLGQGKNYAFLQKLNEKYGWWQEVVALPHPRWVMQYKLKRKEEFVELYAKELVVSTALNDRDS